MDLEKLPKALKNKNIFCSWKYEQQENGRLTKPPYNPITGKKAATDNLSDFTSLDDAMKVKDQYDGIGIKLVDNFLGIDLDHCIDNGIIKDWAKDIISHFKHAYIEYSPSKHGFHILLLFNGTYDKKAYYIKHGDIEVYSALATNRYLTVTGDVYQEGELLEDDAAIMWLLDTYMKRNINTHEKENNVCASSYLSDTAVIEKAGNAVNGAKFTALWHGDISAYPSHSEADAALVSILAFYCGGNKEQIDRLFRKSALFRPKWDEHRGADTYGNTTIQKAVSKCHTFYEPFHNASAEEDFDDLLSKLQELKPDENIRYRNGDLGNGRLFADIFQNILHYVPERKMWFIFDGVRWTCDIGTLKTMELCKDLALSLIRYAGVIKDERTRSMLVEYWNKWSSRRNREIYIKEAQSVYPISMEAFDKNIYLFNCQNGTLDLQHGVFRKHLATDLITKVSPVFYDPKARSERFRQFVDEIMSGDCEKALYLQKSLGYALSGDTRYECMFFLFGESTRNGKGTLMESVLSVMGDYGKAVRAETIALKKNPNSSQPTEDVARLAGVRFANISEPSRGLFLNSAQVKYMTGSDTLNARFLHENSFDFKPQFKLYVNTNYLPVISDMTVFSSDRMQIIPFNRHFEAWEQDKTLKAEFSKKEVQSAILNWLLEGFTHLRDEGFKPPNSVLDAIFSYAHDSDKMAQFAEDVLVKDQSSEIRTAVVYDHYKKWCIDNGCFSENSRNFNQELRKFAEVVRKRPNTGGEKTTLLKGYRLKSEFSDFLSGN